MMMDEDPLKCDEWTCKTDKSMEIGIRHMKEG
jgi:hypothetical protein